MSPAARGVRKKRVTATGIDAVPLKFSNLDKIYFPKTGHTKGDVMRYYADVAPVLLPLIKDRPLVLKRFPDGVDGPAFFQQNAGETPPGVRAERVPAEGGPSPRIIGGDLTTLLYCVQLGAIEVNPWHVRVTSIDMPDQAIIDLDPGPKAKFTTIVEIAQTLKSYLDEAELTAGIKTSGSRGMHIVIPLPPKTNEDACQLIAHVVAQRVADEMPSVATVVRSRSARSDKAVYIDYLQNVIGKSVASAFSIRARPDATISMPLSWDEVTPALDPKAFTIDTPRKELLARGKAWLKVMTAKQSLSAFLRGNEK